MTFPSCHTKTMTMTMKNDPDTLPSWMVEKMEGEHSHFALFLYSIFDPIDVAKMIIRYHLGADHYGNVIFWQIDEAGRVRTGKRMRYDQITGRRIKDGRSVSWIHATMARRGQLPEGWQLQQCLFGLHQIAEPKNKGKKIGLVESEKTAVICSGAMPSYIWMAVGGKENLTPEKLRPLQGWKVVVFPDVDGVKEWKKAVAGLDGVSVSDWHIKGEADDHGDIADLIIRERLADDESVRRGMYALRLSLQAAREGRRYAMPEEGAKKPQAARLPRDEPTFHRFISHRFPRLAACSVPLSLQEYSRLCEQHGEAKIQMKIAEAERMAIPKGMTAVEVIEDRLRFPIWEEGEGIRMFYYNSFKNEKTR